MNISSIFAYMDHNEDDMNLDDAMFLDRMGHIQVQIDEKIQSHIDALAQELFDKNPNNSLLARIQVVAEPEDKSKKRVLVDDSLYAHLNIRLDMKGSAAQVLINLEKVPDTTEEIQVSQNRNAFLEFLRGRDTA